MPCVHIVGMGVVSALGVGLDQTLASLNQNDICLKPLTHFNPAGQDPLPVGQAPVQYDRHSAPTRTLHLAQVAADQAMEHCKKPIDAIVIGVTTGGMAETERYLMAGETDPAVYKHHAISLVAEALSDRFDCKGPAITISTACSSGNAAIKLAMEMIRKGDAKRVLAGGADALCRLTYYGFKSLQLIDPKGARPLDKNRNGMSVAEGAGMLLLEKGPSDKNILQLLGAGLSCDAWHPAKPHPDGKGAVAAIEAALVDAGTDRDAIDYINLHGTGTPDNDRAEALAINRVFDDPLPLLSSVKGTTGHSLGAAGAIEAVISALCIAHQLVPANAGLKKMDPGINLAPVKRSKPAKIETVLSNAFGFGGNNAAVVVGRRNVNLSAEKPGLAGKLAVKGWAAITGAGDLDQTLTQLEKGTPCTGKADESVIEKNLPPAMTRRLKRLSKLSLCLADNAWEKAGRKDPPGAVCFGTGWGSLSETSDFLDRLFETRERFPSPIDFIGSVHNAPAGQAALYLKAKGPNITASGGCYSFEQALLSARLLMGENRSALVMAADEAHEKLSPLFDPYATANGLSDGGGALWLTSDLEGGGPFIQQLFYEKARDSKKQMTRLFHAVAGRMNINDTCGLIMAGLPPFCKDRAHGQLDRFLSLSGYQGPVVDLYRHLGSFSSSCGAAAAISVEIADRGRIPTLFCKTDPRSLEGKRVLVLNLGSTLTAMDIIPS